VLELGSSFVREKVKALASGIEVVGRDPAADMDHSQSYRINGDFGSLYRALRSFPNRVVCGDLGSFTMDAARTVDACLCYGASVAVGVGCSLGQHPGSVFAVTGDAAFLHTGQVCIEEARKRAAQLVVIILDNGSAKSTGGQVVPGSIRLPPDLPVVTMEHSMATAEMYRSALARLCCESGVTVLHVRC
jgi:TPP-dependent indolepyruvate ferredoxin oxidoreductase alpha subunit